jgi:hypothetical protein
VRSLLRKTKGFGNTSGVLSASCGDVTFASSSTSYRFSSGSDELGGVLAS